MTIGQRLPERLNGVPWGLGLFLVFALFVAPIDAEAKGQGRGKNKGDKNGQGPAFCRSGAGHPVHGRQWCRDKGWDTTSSIWETRDRRDDGRVIVIDRDREDDRDRDRDDDNRRAEPRIRWPF